MRKNWAGNVTYSARAFHEPTTVAQVRSVLASSDRARFLGTRHSFNGLADTDGDLISLAGLPSVVEIDSVAMAARVSGGMRYGELAEHLHGAGYGLHNLGSLPHLSVAGAVATATHGSGTANLATAVSSLEVVTALGEVIELSGAGVPVSLGLLGAVTALTLKLEPAYEVRQFVYDDVTGPWRDVLSAAYSVSVFTAWDGRYQAWVKARDDFQAPASWRLADGERHPIRGVSAQACTAQGGVPGPWHERLPHFRLSHTPSAGAELQSEFFVPLADAEAAIEAMASIGERLRPVLLISELRTVLADRLWLSPAYERDCLAIHFTWTQDTAAVLEAITLVQDVLRPFAPRPHWGKVFTMPISGLYPKLADFAALIRAYDPKGKLRNAFVNTMLAE